MCILKKIKKINPVFSNYLIITVLSGFLFSSCHIFKKVPKDERDDSIQLVWDNNLKPVDNSTEVGSDNQDNNNNTDKPVNSPEDINNVYGNIFGYTLTGEENPLLLKEVSMWLGTKYKYGGNSLEGTDCSGFVGKVYEHVFDKQLSRSAAGMYNDVTPVKKEELQHGDIIFFKINGKTISHVGLYISNNKFVHASSSRGVVVNDLDENYYKQRFYSGGRVEK